MNLGAFLGGVASGFSMDRVLSNSQAMQKIARERGLQELREKSMAEAEAKRAQAIDSMISERQPEAPKSGPVSTETPKVEAPAATPVSPPAAVESAPLPPVGPRPPGVGASAEGSEGEAEAMAARPVQATPAQVVQATPGQAVAAGGVAGAGQTGFFVNGQRYETREQARAAAEKAAPSTTDFFMKHAVPKIAEQYMVNGDPATAKAWTDYAESHNGKRAIKDWAAAYSAPDFDTAVSRFGKYYTEHINDGVDYTGHKMLTKEDGTQVAVVTLKDKATGKSTEMELTREKMLALGGANNPQKLFEQEVAKQREAEKLKLEAGLKAQERKAKREDDIFMEGVRQGGRLQVEGAKARNKIDELAFKYEMDAEFEQKYKKTTDPDERRAILRSDAMKNDPKFARMSKEEQNKYLDDAEDTLKSKFRRQESGPATDAAAPKFADKPMPFDKALPVYRNNKTGQRFHLKDGVMHPIAEAPAAQPAPAPAAAPTPAPAQTAPAAPTRPQASGMPAQPAPAAATEPAPAAEPTDPGPQPERQASESFSDYRARVLVWDRQKRAYEVFAERRRNEMLAAQEKAQLEASRQEALRNRPDLARIGGGLR